jgi:hypothetical protein
VWVIPDQKQLLICVDLGGEHFVYGHVHVEGGNPLVLQQRETAQDEVSARTTCPYH